MINVHAFKLKSLAIIYLKCCQ